MTAMVLAMVMLVVLWCWRQLTGHIQSATTVPYGSCEWTLVREEEMGTRKGKHLHISPDDGVDGA